MSSRATLAGAVLVTIASGCGDDSTSPSNGSGTPGETLTDGGDTAPTGGQDTTDSANPTADPASGSDSDVDSGESSGMSAGTSAGTDDADPLATCGDIDCGPNGLCDVDAEGQPFCACDDAYVSIGLECVRCVPVSGDYSPEVINALVTVIPLINETPPPASHNNDANIVLRSLDSGDEVWLGNTHSQEISRSVIPGQYEVFYEFESGGELVPVNRHARLGVFQLDDAEPFKLEIFATTLDVVVTINGSPPPADPQRFGEIYLVNPATGDEALLGNTVDGTFSATVIPGPYDVHYRVKKDGLGIPANVDAKLIQGFQVPEAGEVVPQLNVDIAMSRVDGSILIGNTEPPNDGSDFGRLELVDPQTGSHTPLADTLDQTYEIDVVANDYAVLYRGIQPGATVPANKAALLPGVVLEAQGDASATISIDAVEIAGPITVEGIPPNQTGIESARISLRNLDTGDEVFIGNTLDAEYRAVVVAGTYGAYYSQVAAGEGLPVNTNAFLREFRVGDNANDSGSPVDIQVETVRGNFSVADSAPPDSAYDDGRIFLYDRRSGDTALLGNTRQLTYEARVVPGTYEAVYSAELSDGLVPLNKFSVVAQAAEWGLAGNTGYPVDVSLSIVEGVIRLESGIENAAPGVGHMFLENVDGADLVYLGHTGSPTFERALTGGRYLVRYRAVAGPDGVLSDALPANANAALECIDLTNPQ